MKLIVGMGIIVWGNSLLWRGNKDIVLTGVKLLSWDRMFHRGEVCLTLIRDTQNVS